MRVSDVGRALGLEGLGTEAITGLSVDSRAIRPGDCFVALHGPNQDASRFIPDALAAGAVFAIGGPDSQPGDGVAIVDDPLFALGTFGRLVRDRFTGPVVGITGSAGKTTVKEMLRALVAPHRNAVFPEASHNNFEGVPRTLARMTADTEVCVVELGTNAKGEIGALCAIARPTMGVLTAIGPAHLEGLGSVAGVLDEKLALVRALPEGACLIVNSDDPKLRDARLPGHVDVRWVGLDAAPGVVAPPAERAPRTLPLSDGVVLSHSLATRVLERNLWIAVQIARELGVDDAAIAASGAAIAPAPLRGEVTTRGDTTFVLDCYNANPMSMTEAVRDLATRSGRRAAVLGDMLELGGASDVFHERLGQLVAEVRLDRVLFVGASGTPFRDGYVAAGGAPDALELRPDVASARPAFADVRSGGGTVLLKASRGVALERLLEPEPHDG